MANGRQRPGRPSCVHRRGPRRSARRGFFASRGGAKRQPARRPRIEVAQPINIFLAFSARRVVLRQQLSYASISRRTSGARSGSGVQSIRSCMSRASRLSAGQPAAWPASSPGSRYLPARLGCQNTAGAPAAVRRAVRRFSTCAPPSSRRRNTGWTRPSVDVRPRHRLCAVSTAARISLEWA